MFEYVQAPKLSKRDFLGRLALSGLTLLLGTLWLVIGHDFLGYSFTALGAVGLVLWSVRWKNAQREQRGIWPGSERK
jgi:hypothetical protein